MRKLLKIGLMTLLTMGLLVLTAVGRDLDKPQLEIIEGTESILFQVKTGKPDYWHLDTRYRLTMLPETFEQQKPLEDEFYHSIFYFERKSGRCIDFAQLAESSGIQVMSQPSDILERVKIGDKDGGLIVFGRDRTSDFKLIWYDPEAASYFSLHTAGFTRDELIHLAESIDAESQFCAMEIPWAGFHDCVCGGTFWQFRRPKLQKTIDRDSPNQQGTKWIYVFQYVCDGCNWHVDIFRPAIPVE